MPEQTKNAAVSGEWKLVPVAQLKKWHRDLDACQKVMWLRGGFDPAYCMDAQDCLKEMEGVLAAPVPPAGGEIEVQIQHANVLGRGQRYVVLLEDHRAHVTRLQAENAALQQLLTIADQRVDELQSTLDGRDEIVGDLSAMVKRLVHHLRKAAPDNDLPDLAADYLRRKCLAGTPLRESIDASEITHPAQ